MPRQPLRSRFCLALAPALAAMLIAACMMPPQGGELTAGAGPAEDPDHAFAGDEEGSSYHEQTTLAPGAATCEHVCRKSEQCEIIASYDACLPKCKANTPEQGFMDEWVSSSCDAIWSYSMQQAGAGGGDGNGCRSHGANDCPSMTVCCNGNAATGTPGQCISAPICHMPTR